MIGTALLIASATPAPLLSDIEMRLWYESSGRLSADLTQRPDFAGWNVIIGEGDADEPANDLVVVVKLESESEANVAGPLTVKVTNAKGKSLASRTFRNIYIAREGRAYFPLFVPNVGCVGDMKVVARIGSQSRSESLSLNCGE